MNRKMEAAAAAGFALVISLAGGCAARCEAAPRNNESCDTVFRPVCGCDGETYGNECEATKQHQVEVVHEGECILE